MIPFSQFEPLIMADKRKRTNLSIADKVKILDRLKNGSKKEDIMTEFKIVQRTLQRIAKSEKEIRQDALSMQSTKKRKRAGRYKDVDTAMEKWFTLARQNNLKLTGTQLIKKAKDFAKDLGLQNYTPSTG